MAPDWGLLGGIGEGFQKGIDSYRTERNYQLEKKKQAQEQEFKETTLGLHQGEVAAKFLEQGGSEALEKYGNMYHLIPKKQMGLVTSQASTDTDGGLLSSDPMSQSGGILSKNEREMQKFATEKNATEGETGRHLEWDSKAKKFNVSQVPVSEETQVKRDTAKAELKTKNTQPEFHMYNEYTQEPSVKTMRDTAFSYNKILEHSKHPSPFSDKGLTFDFVRIENPNMGARESSLEDIRHNNPGLYNKYSNIISQAMNGTMSDETRNDIIRASTKTYQAARAAHREEQQKYINRAQQLGINTSLFQDPSISKLDKLADEADQRVGNYKPPKGLMTMAKDFLSGPSDTAQAVEGPKIGEVKNGYSYQGGDPSNKASWKKVN